MPQIVPPKQIESPPNAERITPQEQDSVAGTQLLDQVAASHPGIRKVWVGGAKPKRPSRAEPSSCWASGTPTTKPAPPNSSLANEPHSNNSASLGPEHTTTLPPGQDALRAPSRPAPDPLPNLVGGQSQDRIGMGSQP